LTAGIRLSEACCDNRYPGEWQGHLTGVKFEGGMWHWDDRGDVDSDVEGSDGFVGDGQDIVDDSTSPFT